MDSNHYRTGIYPTPSGQLKVRYPLCFVGMVRYHQFESHAYRRILLSVSSRAANYAPHRLTMLHGELSATSPAHHRMAINHLLHRLIYDALLRTRCHTEGKYDYYSKSCGCSYLPFFCKGFPVYLIFQSVGKSVTNLRGALSFRVKDLSLLALYIEFCGVFYPKMCTSTIVPISNTTVSMSAKVKSITCCLVHPLKNVILISLNIVLPFSQINPCSQSSAGCPPASVSRRGIFCPSESTLYYRQLFPCH